MNNQLLIDLWHDMRQKHMVPVAIVLALALVAVPLLLKKDPKEPAAAAPVAAVPSAPPELVAVSDVQESREDSQLGTFDPKDPFEPQGEPPTSSSKTLVATDTLGGGTSTATGGSSTSPQAPAAVASAGGSAGGGSSSGSSGSSGTGSPASPPSPTPRVITRKRTTTYTYVADLQFGRRGEERRRRGVQRLTVLPSTRNPLLVFLGISANRKQAVFLVDSTASHSGEGTCRPDVRHCSFLYLSRAGDNDEHFLTDAQGTDYGLRLAGIRRVPVRRSRKSATSSRRTSKGPARFFEFPLFADESR